MNPAARNARTLAAFAGAICAQSGVPGSACGGLLRLGRGQARHRGGLGPPQSLPPTDQQRRGRAAGCPHLYARPDGIAVSQRPGQPRTGPITPASRCDGIGTIVTPLSAGGNRPAATSSSTASKRPIPRLVSHAPSPPGATDSPGSHCDELGARAEVAEHANAGIADLGQPGRVEEDRKPVRQPA